MLGAAQADPLGPEAAGVGRVGTGVGVGPHLELALADLVGPSQHGGELGWRLGRRQRDLTEDDLAARAVDGDERSLLDRDPPDREAVAVDANRLRAHDRGLAPTAGDHRGVADQAAP